MGLSSKSWSETKRGTKRETVGHGSLLFPVLPWQQKMRNLQPSKKLYRWRLSRLRGSRQALGPKPVSSGEPPESNRGRCDWLRRRTPRSPCENRTGLVRASLPSNCAFGYLHLSHHAMTIQSRPLRLTSTLTVNEPSRIIDEHFSYVGEHRLFLLISHLR
jgi:hypothetical protein